MSFSKTDPRFSNNFFKDLFISLLNFCLAQKPFEWSLGKGAKPLNLFCRENDNSTILSFVCWNQWLNRNISLKFKTSKFGLCMSWSILSLLLFQHPKLVLMFFGQVIMLIFHFESSKILNFMWREYSDFFYVISSDN